MRWSSGAPPFLVAYNVYLAQPDVEIAPRRSPRRIRESSGGLPAVQAKGFLVEGQAQVSMNLLDTQRRRRCTWSSTRSARLAAEQGVTLDRSELIGLAPQQVMLAAAAHSLKLPMEEAERTVENAIQPPPPPPPPSLPFPPLLIR